MPRSLQYAFEACGYDPPTDAAVRTVIGPPFEVGLPSLGIPVDDVERVVAAYQVRYEDIGLFENTVYVGVAEMLDELAAAGHTLAIATAKPEHTAKRIIEHFGFTHHFAVQAGASREVGVGRRTKAEVIDYALIRLQLAPADLRTRGDDRRPRSRRGRRPPQRHRLHRCHVGVRIARGAPQRRCCCTRGHPRRSCRGGAGDVPFCSSMSTTADQPPIRTATAPDVAGDAAAPSSTDRFMLRLLRLPEGRTSTADEARSAFQKSLFISTCRCLLMYIVFPFVLPAVGIARGVGPYIGVVIGLLAMVSIVYSIRRFWRANHSKRWHYTIFGTIIIAFLIYLAVKDLSTILS